jgi:hypothetical protein
MGDLIFGIVFILLGLITIYLRVFKKSKGLGKLETMKETYGEKLGLVIHVISYTVVPIVTGIVMVVRYLQCHLLIF